MSTFKRKCNNDLITGSYWCNKKMVENEMNDIATKVYNYNHQFRRPVSPFQSQGNVQCNDNEVYNSPSHPIMIMDGMQETGNLYLPFRPMKRIRFSLDHKTTVDESKNQVNNIIIEELSSSVQTQTTNNSHTIMNRPWWKTAPKKKEDISNSERFESYDANTCLEKTEVNAQQCCFVCRRSSKSCDKKHHSLISESLQQNSLLSYFSKLDVGNKGSNRGTKACNNGEHKSNLKNTDMSVKNNHRYQEQELIHLKSCYFCDKLACEKCVHECESCKKIYCSFCTTTSYNHGRDEQVFCLDCVSTFDHCNQNLEQENMKYENQNDMMID